MADHLYYLMVALAAVCIAFSMWWGCYGLLVLAYEVLCEFVRALFRVRKKRDYGR